MKELILFLCLMSSLSTMAGSYSDSFNYDRHSSVLDGYSAMTGLNLSIKETAPYRTEYLPEEEKYREKLIPFLNKTDMYTIAAASAVAVIFFANDEAVMEFAQDHKSEVTQNLAQYGEAFGDKLGVGAALTGIVIGVVLDNDKIKKVSLLATTALFVAGLTTQVLKHTIHRVRPNSSEDPYIFHGPSTSHDNISFPSGHTAAAFALATVIAESTKDKGMLIPILAYSSAVLTGWSRVHDKAHWGSDVIIGALIGHIIAKSMMNARPSNKGFTIYPSLGERGYYGINIRYTGKSSEFSSCAVGVSQYKAVERCFNHYLAE